jgi:Tol biopolymer transport system component
LQYVAAGLRRETDRDSVKPALLRRPSALLPAAVLVLVLLVSAVVWFTKRVPSPPSGPLELTQRQLTENSSENAVGSGAISPDGNYLAYSDARGMHRKVIETGETQAIPPPPDFNGVQVNWGIVPAWADGGTRLLANAMISGQRPSVWTVPVMGGAPLKVRDDAFAYSVSRDGSRVAFATKPNKITWSELWMMRPDGKQAQRLYEADANNGFGGAEWSPDGQRVAYSRPRVLADKFENSIESRPLGGGRPTTIVPSANRLQDWCWSPDGRMIYSLSEPEPNETSCNLWATRVDARTGEPRGQPQRLTNWAGFCLDTPSATADGKRLAFRKWSRQGNVYVADLQANGKRITTPKRLTLSEGSSYPRAWTADSKAVIFRSKRNGKAGIFKQALNEDTAQPIVTGSDDAYEPRMSPDGAWILYVTPLKTGGFYAPLQLMRVPIVGGTAQVVLTADFSGHRCARSPATLCAICERTPIASSSSSQPSTRWKAAVVSSAGLMGTRARLTGGTSRRMAPISPF